MALLQQRVRFVWRASKGALGAGAAAWRCAACGLQPEGARALVAFPTIEPAGRADKALGASRRSRSHPRSLCRAPPLSRRSPHTTQSALLGRSAAFRPSIVRRAPLIVRANIQVRAIALNVARAIDGSAITLERIAHAGEDISA